MQCHIYPVQMQFQDPGEYKLLLQMAWLYKVIIDKTLQVQLGYETFYSRESLLSSTEENLNL